MSPMRIRFALMLALALPQRTPVGGAITKYGPPAPTPALFISDERGVLTADAHVAIDAHIAGVQQAGLGDIAVAILPSIGDYSANQVAVEIYRTWKVGSVAAIGSARRDVGVLILIVPKELAANHRGECWIATGTGAEGIITDATAGSICRDAIIPHLRAKAYAAAVEAGVSGVEARLRADRGLAAAGASAGLHSPIAQGEALALTAPSSRLPFVFGGFGIVALLASIVGALEWRRSHRRKCPRCGRMMRRLDEATTTRSSIVGRTSRSNSAAWTTMCGSASAARPRCFPTAHASAGVSSAACATGVPRRMSAPCWSRRPR